MAPRIIFKYYGWTITQDPTDCNPNLVQFRSRWAGNLFDEIAEWDPAAQAWVPNRWVPESPKVPLALINWVVAHMRGQAS